MTIFERRRNRVELTVRGEQLVQQAQCVLEEVERLVLLAAQGKDQLNGRLRLGVIATIVQLVRSSLASERRAGEFIGDFR